MRKVLACIIVLVSAPAIAQQYGYGSADYSIERWDEDYSYLKPPAKKTDFFDPIKYVSLGANSDWYVSFGGQARERYDYFNNTNFGAGKQDEDGFRLTRLLAHADAHFGPNFRAFVQLEGSLGNDRAGGLRPGDADDFDIQQAFGDLTLPISASASAVVRIGRQELIYGAQRLISPNDWANVRRTFDGAKVSLQLPNDTLDVFWVRPVVIDKSHFNSDDNHAWFAGVYNVMALPTLIRDANSKVDLYLLALEAARSSQHPTPADTYTLGARFHTTPTPWDFDVEADWQFGGLGGASINAWALAAEAGYTFSAVSGKPRASIGVDSASGSPNPAHRFNQLFPPQYLYLGHMYVLGRENLIDAHAALDFDLTHGVTLSLAEHAFWRENTRDAAYNLTGGIVRSGASNASSIGNEFDAVINWQIQKNISAYMGYAHFFTGDFIRETGPNADIDFFYAAVTLTF